MKRHLSQLWTQPHIIVIASVAALWLLWVIWLAVDPNLQGLRGQTFLLALLLAAGVVIADTAPIQLGPHFKVSITTVPLFLMAALLPPPLAGLTAGGSVLFAEVLSRAKRLRLPVEIAAASGRWGLVVFLSATIILLPWGNEALYPVRLFVAAIGMFLSDVLSTALELKLLSKESFWRETLHIAREAALIEPMQYVLGIIGALAAREYTWVLILLALPIFVTYLAFKSIKETRPVMDRMVHTLNSLYSNKNESPLSATFPKARIPVQVDSTETDYYSILQVAPNARQEEIDLAYRRLTHLYHPDLNPSPDSEGRMRAVNEAYEVLGNPIKRTSYNRIAALVSDGLSIEEDTDPDPHFAFIAQVLQHELRQGCQDGELLDGLEGYAQDWAHHIAQESPENRQRAASVAAFLQNYSQKTQVERAQAILQALARARNQPVPFFRVGMDLNSALPENAGTADSRVESPEGRETSTPLLRIAFRDLAWKHYLTFIGMTIAVGLIIAALFLVRLLLEASP